MVNDSYVMPAEGVAGDAIAYLERVLNDPDSIPIEEAPRRVAAAVAILNAYVTMRTWERRRVELPDRKQGG